jgi:hypothetical protein
VWEPPRPSGNNRKATGRGDTDRLLTRGKLRRVVHREEGDQGTGDLTDSFVGKPGSWRAPNAMNPMTGSGMQQARNQGAEKTGEVVRNHEVGTSSYPWQGAAEGSTSLSPRIEPASETEGFAGRKTSDREWTRREESGACEGRANHSRNIGEGEDLETTP